jgi:hypothetical protein
VCGVGKSDFILIGEDTPEQASNEGIVVAKEFLTSDVIELKISSEAQFFVIP